MLSLRVQTAQVMASSSSSSSFSSRKLPAGEPPESSLPENKSPLRSPSSYNSTHSFESSPVNNKAPQELPSRDQIKEELNRTGEKPASQKSSSRDEGKDEINQSRKRVASPPLSPLKFKSSPSIKIQPPLLSTLEQSEPSPSPLTVSNRIINQNIRSPNFDEEAVESPLRVASLDRRDRVSDQAVTGRGNGATNRVVPEALWKAETRWTMIGLRFLTAVFCMVSLSLMAVDRTSGWDGDVYNRHREYVYCLTVNAMTFAYSSLQIFKEIHNIRTSKHLIPIPQAYYLDLVMDQILAYLLMSASSSAASRNDIWVTRFGGDVFTRKISGSVAMSFLAFISLALSSVISTFVLVSWIS